MSSLKLEFLETTQLILDKLEVEGVEPTIEETETPKIGVAYLSHGASEDIGFSFNLWTKSTGDDLSVWSDLSLSLSFHNKYGVCQLYKRNDYKASDNPSVSAWVSSLLDEYLDRRNRKELGFLFGDRDICVRGSAGITNFTIIELTLYLKGYLSWGADRLLLYRFHHRVENEESRSYAFLIECHGGFFDYSYWVVFPDFVGTSGGTGRGGLKTMESLIDETQSRLKMEIVDIEISTQEFMKFLKEKARQSV